MYLQQTTFEDIVAKEEIAHNNEQFLFSWPQYFQLFSIIILSHIHRRLFMYFSCIFSKLSAADLLFVGKGLPESWPLP